VTPSVAPLPAVAAGAGPFTVTHCAVRQGGHSAAPVQGEPGLFGAPLGPGAGEALAIRQHEYGHLGLVLRGILSRDTLPALRRHGVHERWIQSGLDVIVNGYMLAQGNAEIALLRPWTGPAPKNRAIAAMNHLRCEGMAMAGTGRDALTRAAVLGPGDLALLERTADALWRLGRDARPVGAALLAQLLGELQRAFGPVPRGGQARAAPSFVLPGSAAAAHVDSGPMETVRPMLLDRGRSRRRSRSFRAGETGPFRYPHRALLPGADGRAFGARRRAPAGAMLVDCSGSMSLQQADLERAVATAPAMIVALYGSLPDDLDAGRLVIVAADGRMTDVAAARAGLGIGNVVDVPALRWLCRQSAPRVWISDGGVTGVGDKMGQNLTQEAADLVRDGRVRRVRSIAEYLGAPTRTRPGGVSAA
jgi:hypothetical protein